jgi:hypothetical protein
MYNIGEREKDSTYGLTETARILTNGHFICNETIYIILKMNCKHCNTVKLRSEFPSRSTICKQCKNAKQRKYYKKNSKRLNRQMYQYQKNKMKTNPLFRLQKNLRRRLRKICKHKGDTTMGLVHCSSDHLRTYLEAQFQPGMAWDNYGSAWEIDHMMPCCSFDLEQTKEQYKCYHYTNMQPLFKRQNLSKGKKIVHDMKWNGTQWLIKQNGSYMLR